MKFYVSLLAAIAYAEKAHPVRQEVVDQVRLRTSSWQPRAVHENHLRHYAVDKLPLGNLGTDDYSTSPLEVGIKAINFTKEKFDQLTNLVGSHHASKQHTPKLRDYSDWDITPDDDVYPTDADAANDDSDDSDSQEPEEEVISETGEHSEEHHKQHIDEREAEKDEEHEEYGIEFNWRDESPECLGEIYDQGHCGSCWAFTSSGFLSDRFCIHS